MRLPAVTGLIRRRLLIDYRADSEVTKRLLPAGLSPKLHNSHAIVGVCLIRLEGIRPKGLPSLIGLSSENAAHRIAVEWTGPDGGLEEGVFIPRRDTGSKLSVMIGGRIFPAEHHHSRFSVRDNGQTVTLKMTPDDSAAAIEVSGEQSPSFPDSSCFDSLQEASTFFSHGCIGYSVTRDANRLDGLKLCTVDWQVAPFAVSEVHSGFFADSNLFPKGSIEFDHALVMRNLQHDWLALPPLQCGPAATPEPQQPPTAPAS